MSECLRCGRELIDPNAKYGWRCAQKVGVPYGNSDSILKKFPELEKQYNFLSASSKKKFDEYFDEMEEKNSYVNTAMEGAGMYISVADELEKAYNEEVARKTSQNQRIDNLMKTKIELEKNRKLEELQTLEKIIEQAEKENTVLDNELGKKQEINSESLQENDSNPNEIVTVYDSVTGKESQCLASEIAQKRQGDETGKWYTSDEIVTVYDSVTGKMSQCIASEIAQKIQGDATGKWYTSNQIVKIYDENSEEKTVKAKELKKYLSEGYSLTRPQKIYKINNEDRLRNIDRTALAAGIITESQYNTILEAEEDFKEAERNNDYEAMNEAHARKGAIRRLNDSNYVDDYDYTHGDKYNNHNIKLAEMPPKESGYVPPKTGKSTWDKEKKGWIDKDGNAWVKDKGADGGEHWDVQYPNGGYDNVYPNGHVRKGKGGRGKFSPIEVIVNSNDVALAGALVVGGYVIYQGIKWGIAAITAGPTGGVSLGLALITP